VTKDVPKWDRKIFPFVQNSQQVKSLVENWTVRVKD
jgi:hypothetical protein